MPKVVSAKCPECGARLKVDPTASQATCEYCKAVSPIQTEKQVKQSAQSGAQINAIQIKSSGTKIAMMVVLMPLIGILATGIITFSMVMRSTGSNSSVSDSLDNLGSAFSNINMQWHGGAQPVLMDVTGDGVLDPIGRIRKFAISTSVHTEHLAAYDAITGKVVWMSSSLGDVSQGHHLRIAQVGTTLLVADTMGVLKAIEPVNGQVRWSATVGERVEQICGSSAGLARLETTDKRAVSVVLATGQLTPAGKVDPKAQCLGVWSTQPKGNTPWMTKIGGPFFRGEPLPEIKGMTVEYVFRENATLTSIAVGQKAEGTRVPMAASYDPRAAIAKAKTKTFHHFNKIKTTPKWLTNIPAVNPLTVYEDSPELGAISVGRIVIPYRMSDSKNGWRLACLELATGRSLWDVQIPNPDTSPGAITASPRLIFLSSWQGFHIFDLATGAHRKTIAGR